MARLTRKQLRQLRSALHLIADANRDVFDDRHALCLIVGAPSHSKCYTAPGTDKTLVEVNRDSGSTVSYYRKAEAVLRDFIDEHSEGLSNDE